MKMKSLVVASLCMSFAGAASAQINNAGFEDAFDGWRVSDPNNVITISNIANSGTRSGRIRSNGGRLSQTVDVEANSTYRLTAQLRGAGRLNAEVNGQRTTDRVNNGSEYGPLSIEFETGNSNEAEIFMEFSGSEGRWDDIELTRISGGADDIDFGLNPNNEPWENFDLSDWALDAPNADPSDGLSARTSDRDFIEGDLFPGSEPFFFTGSDGAMVFRSPIDGVRTSSNTSFPRSELREMLRAGDTSVSTQGVTENNWALGYQPNNLDIGAFASNDRAEDIGGRGGRLTATMRVNRVTSTGSSSQVGRVIIGQIHADNDEPIRLYYRKLPNNDLGSIYFTHEIRDGDDLDDVNLVGSSSSNASNPSDGIALGELFSYEIINEGSVIEVVLRSGDKDGPIIGQASFDMDQENSGYDLDDEWMYFKAGAYTQNNTGDGDDFDEVAIYRLENTH